MSNERLRLPKRDVHGVVLLDKPLGLSSNAALQAVKRLYRVRKAGHTGSLDPQATGMLPICLGEATKVSAYLLDADKTYDFVCRLGVTTTTGDAEGEVLERRPLPAALSVAQVEAVLARFRGEIEQIPPMYSALRYQGQRLYRLARQGVEVERAPRTVTIHTLALRALEGERLACTVRCSKGTYVRTLAEDIGRALGCGAHVVELRRSAVSPYAAAAMVGLDELERLAEQGEAALDARLLPVDSAIAHWPALHVGADSAHYLRHGNPVLVPRAPTRGLVRLYQGETRFLGIGEILDDGRVAPRRLVQLPAETEHGLAG
ncbi:MAG TPA: tRNA pseudouridine(55) synthase TruB [Candidatus Competibacteraceae bacterium]|nr:tRNA pseudouridine(55) synthase TruB [Candidatus Competibacteraceae bacterium]